MGALSSSELPALVLEREDAVTYVLSSEEKAVQLSSCFGTSNVSVDPLCVLKASQLAAPRARVHARQLAADTMGLSL